ncbi:hypothetical protein [Nocardia brevicatena]|uniref:hypothetical protein n=1 Tax=Nocardia brevicatena TaxID=37327 RepID=UPI00059496B2|nr:hypothetical protein [Nocardia brevicatena]
MVITHTDEILDYFGKCASCGYPAHASAITRVYDNGDTECPVTATCALPCGWSDRVVPVTMTERSVRSR